MLFKVWISREEEFHFSIIFEADSVEGAFNLARLYADKYKGRVKALDNIHSGTVVKAEARKKHEILR